jgi:hypothetical protein
MQTELILNVGPRPAFAVLAEAVVALRRRRPMDRPDLFAPIAVALSLSRARSSAVRVLAGARWEAAAARRDGAGADDSPRTPSHGPHVVVTIS